MSADSPTPSQRALPVVVREALDAVRAGDGDAPVDEREFAAQLHRRLVAAGPPPSTWLERLREFARAAGHDSPQQRSLLTGAILGALATATTFLLLSNSHPLHETGAARPGVETSSAQVKMKGEPSATVSGVDHKGHRAVGDRRPTRDRLGLDIGAERPERAK
ncbi:MAG TPA: hypothetical protein VH560_09630 [Polyangia bacterium]|jgi:hypothetical protein|nr:hypothetical protein [Polyangia bacterium]